MLFLVNKAGTPSLATWVQVSGAAAAVARVEFHPERVPTPRYIVQRKHVTESALPMRKEMHMHEFRRTEMSCHPVAMSSIIMILL